MLEEKVGCAIARRMVDALVGEGIPYNRLVEIVYGEFERMSLNNTPGDWLELPNGDTYTLTFKVRSTNCPNCGRVVPGPGLCVPCGRVGAR